MKDNLFFLINWRGPQIFLLQKKDDLNILPIYLENDLKKRGEADYMQFQPTAAEQLLQGNLTNTKNKNMYIGTI